jgi:hypothetical protein
MASYGLADCGPPDYTIRAPQNSSHIKESASALRHCLTRMYERISIPSE